ncbi:MAG TPA: hypothetical protein VEW74_04875, partial [Candidatus Nitrosotalea sp.]|nr:hypothetical protein [Candidatus Nitrosotalea sp.]
MSKHENKPIAVVALLLTLAVTISAPGTVTTVGHGGGRGGDHLHGIVRDPITGDIYVADWSTRSEGPSPFFGPYSENRDSIRRINQMSEVSIVTYALSA